MMYYSLKVTNQITIFILPVKFDFVFTKSYITYVFDFTAVKYFARARLIHN